MAELPSGAVTLLFTDIQGSFALHQRHPQAYRIALDRHYTLVRTAIEAHGGHIISIAIMGTSYGGYATLAGLAFTPDVFAAGVDLVGPSNIVTLLNSTPPHWAPIKARLIQRMGDPERDREFLESRSPLFFAERITAPLLVGQGANDPRVPQRESEQIVDAMRRANKPVEYLVYADEGHGFVRPENNLHFFARAEAFLAQHLGGRCEPATNVQGHSAVEK